MSNIIDEVNEQCFKCFRFDKRLSVCKLNKSNLFGGCEEFIEKQATKHFMPTLKKNIEVINALRLCTEDNLDVRYDTPATLATSANPERGKLLQFIVDVSDYPFLDTGFKFILGYLHTIQPFMLGDAIDPDDSKYVGPLYMYYYPAGASSILIKVNLNNDLSVVVVSFHESTYTQARLRRIYDSWSNELGTPCLDRTIDIMIGMMKTSIFVGRSAFLEGLYFFDLQQFIDEYRNVFMETLDEILGDILYAFIPIAQSRIHGTISAYSMMILSLFWEGQLNSFGQIVCKLEALRICQAIPPGLTLYVTEEDYSRLKQYKLITPGIMKSDIIKLLPSKLGDE